MPPTPVEQLLDMAAVHSFYIGLLEEVLGHPVPVPHEANASAGAAVEQTIEGLQRWLNLLDLAIAPPMVRDALKESTTQETAEALLRHFARKSSRSDADRDKTDFIVTFLYRLLVPREKQIPREINVDEPSEFEEEIYTILASEETLPLPEEHRQLVREFPYIREEVDDYGHFDQLMDSGVIQRVRDIKQRFGDRLSLCGGMDARNLAVRADGGLLCAEPHHAAQRRPLFPGPAPPANRRTRRCGAPSKNGATCSGPNRPGCGCPRSFSPNR